MRSVQPSGCRPTSVTGPLPAVAELRAELPLPAVARAAVAGTRHAVARVNAGADDRLVVVVGPCSAHDPDATVAYAERLAGVAADVAGELLVVMRVYVEKARTRLGWKGMVYDPDLDGSHDLATGLRRSRALMRDVLGVGLPVGCEFIDPLVAPFLSDAVSWGAIGARTVQSQIHRQLASGLDMPVGIKNATNGSVSAAVDTVVAAASGHVFPGVDDTGRAAVLSTAGNPDCHLVLRGSDTGPNYGEVDVARALGLLGAAGCRRGLFVDASHGNSGKHHERQAGVVADLAFRIASGEAGITGVMIESFLTAGRQDLELGRGDWLVYGQSITDSCAGWNQTADMIERLADAVSCRRSPYLAALAG